jgi:CubicO group peptidase (beta-lactamase class C family)
MTANNLPASIPDLGMFSGTGYGLGVSSLLNPASAGNLGSQGNFGWGEAATTHVIIDPKEDMVALYFTQYMPSDFSYINQFQTLVYQAIVD